MKTRLSLLFVLLFVLCSGNKAWSAGPEYCTPVMKNAMVGYIERVTTTGASVDLNFVDPDANTNIQEAHYATVANKVVDSSMKVLPGQTITLTTNAKFARWGEIHLFLDLNADGEFAASEKVAHFGDTDNGGDPNNEEVLSGDQTTEFTVPADATPGVMRMRVIIAGGSYASSGNDGCSDLTNQEGAFYDFEIEVQATYCEPDLTWTGALTRYITGVSVAGTTQSAPTLTGATGYNKVYMDKISETINATREDELTITLTHGGISWMHYYVYVDYNHDGVFNETNELVSFTYYSPTEASAPDSKGVMRGSDYNPEGGVLPSFTIPQDVLTGETRLRIKCDWNSKNPCGNPGEDAAGKNSIDKTCGTIIDYTINIVEKTIPSVAYAVTFSAAENGTFVIKNGATAISSGDKILEKTSLTVEATPKEGYLLDVIKVNGVVIESNVFTVAEVTTVEVSFIKEPEQTSMTAIHFLGSGKQQFRFKDILLGTDGGSLATDKRIYNMTLSAWVKPLSNSGDILAHVQPNMYPLTGSFAVRLTDGKLMLFSRCRDASGGFPDNSSIRKQTETALNVGEWAFITLAIDDTNKKMYLYKDGELVLEQQLNGQGVGLLHDAGMVFVAGHMDFNGDIDEVQVWNKTLTQNEIRTSMGSYASIPDGLLYNYTFKNKADDHTFTNQGMGGECKGMLVAGKEVNQGWWTEYQYSTQEPQMAEGHVLAKYTLTYESETIGGSFVVKNGENVVASGTQLNEGTPLTIVATPAADYQVKSIKVNGEAIEGNSFNLAADATVTVEFSNKLLLNYAYNEAGGEVIVKSGENVIANEGEFVKNSPITITVAPKTGYEVKIFTVNGEDKKSGLVENNYQIANCNENLNVSVEFAIKTFTITYATPESGSIQVKAGSRTVNSGSTVDYGTELTVKLVPTAVSTLATFMINDIDKKSELDKDGKMLVTVTENLTLAATFKDATYKIVYTNTTPGFGTVVAKNYEDDADIANNSDVTKGNYVMIVCTPKEAGQTVTSLKNNGEVVDLESNSSIEIVGNVVTYTIDMQEDMTIEVAFSTPVGINKQNAEVMAYYDAKAQTLNIKEGASVVIYNLAGNAILSSSEQRIDVSALNAGCYLVKVNASGTVKTVKFIKK